MSPSTLDEALTAGPPSDLGWRELKPAPGVRFDGDPVLPAGEVIAVLAHLSDLHICDAESPGRQEYLDVHGQVGQPHRQLLGDIGTYRPNELLTVPVAVSMVHTFNELGRGPLTGRPIDAAVLTGDLTDNAQSNELGWYLDVVSGGVVTPTSGDAQQCGWVGSPDTYWDGGFWHPEGHRSGKLDRFTIDHGFPKLAGLLDGARSPVVSQGLKMPFFSVHGNHDALLQGTVPPDEALQELTSGSRRIVGLDPDQTPLTILQAVPPVGPARYTHTKRSPSAQVAADARRRLVGVGDFATRTEARHGVATRRGPANAFAANVNESVLLVALDTVNPNGGWEGSLDEEQLGWLRRELAATSAPYVVVASHHPLWRLINTFRPDGAPRRVGADEVLRSVLDDPRVVVWLAGHVHHHSVTLHRRGARILPEITSASLIDWPQQSRTLELVREPGGILAIASVAIDHHAPAALKDPDWTRPLHRASLSRSLARNAPNLRPMTRAATHSAPNPEHNVVLRVPDPQR